MTYRKLLVPPQQAECKCKGGKSLKGAHLESFGGLETLNGKINSLAVSMFTLHGCKIHFKVTSRSEKANCPS